MGQTRSPPAPRYLCPYGRSLVAVVALQRIATVANLCCLLNLDADFIDRGVAVGDLTRILIVGGVMLGVSPV